MSSAEFFRQEGEIVPVLTPGFDETLKIENKYRLEVPHEVMEFCQKIANSGGKALVVGGSVRDAVIAEEEGLPVKPKDYDVEVYGIFPEDILSLLKNNFEGHVNMAGNDFEVIKWIVPGMKNPVDISIPRRDSKKQGERGHKAFKVTGDATMNIAEGSVRRDLTVNSMAYDPLTEILYDPNGGINDIKNHVIRATDNERFADDPVRAVRVMQFASRFGFDVAPETIDLCRKIVENGDLDFVSRERIQEEFMKILSKGKKPSLAFEVARKIGFTERYWPELHTLIDTPQNPDWHPEGSVWNHTMQVVDAAAEIADREIAAGKMNPEERGAFIMACLCHDFGKPATTEIMDGVLKSHGHEEAGVEPTKIFFKRIFGNSQAEMLSKVLPLVEQHLKPKEMWINEVQKGINQGRALFRLSRRLAQGDASVYMLSLVAEADQRGRSADGKYFTREEVPELNEWQTWLNQKCEEKKIEVKNNQEQKVLKGADLLRAVGAERGGVWVGIIINAVQLDFLEGLTTQEGAIDKGRTYYEILTALLINQMAETGKNHLEILEEVLKLEDPRDYLNGN